MPLGRGLENAVRGVFFDALLRGEKDVLLLERLHREHGHLVLVALHGDGVGERTARLVRDMLGMSYTPPVDAPAFVKISR